MKRTLTSTTSNASYFFLCDPHIIFNSSENSRLYEKALVTPSGATTFENGSFFFARFDQIHHSVLLLFTNL